MNRSEFEAFAAGKFLLTRDRLQPVSSFWLMLDQFVAGALLAYDYNRGGPDAVTDQLMREDDVAVNNYLTRKLNKEV